MKKHILFSLAIGSLFVLTGCENTNVWEEEQYIKQAYLVGIGEEGALVTRNVNYADESAETFVSVGTSGSLNPDGDIHCTLIEDPSGITSYNQKYKSSTEIQYQALPAANYNISSMNAVIRAGESYARIPVAIHPEGLHCDSLYALPLKMESCKEYPVAQAETVVLFAIKTYNNYSGFYNYIGTNNGASFSLIRNAVAVNKNTIRIYYTGTEELARAKDTGLTITVNEDNSLTMKPYNADFIEVASINEEQPDYYGNYELADVYGGKKRQRFNFKYKYRFKGESKWEIVDMRSLRSVTLDQINE